MDVYIIQKNGYNSSLSHDEFGERTNNLVDRYGNKSFDRGGDFANIPDKFPCIIYFGIIDDDCVRSDHLKWLYIGGWKYG